MHSCGAERKTEISLVVSCQPPDLLVQASDCRKPIRNCQEMASRYEVRLEAAVARPALIFHAWSRPWSC